MDRKFLIIGKGSIGFRHFDLIKSYEKRSVVCHVSSREFLDNYENILNRDFNFIVIAGPVVHREATLEKIDNGSSFYLIEKPMFGSIGNSRVIKNKDKVWVGYNLRFNPLVQMAKRYIGAYPSRVVKVDFLCESDARTWRSGNYLTRVSFNPKLGGGCLNELSHELDLMYFLFAPSKYSIAGNNLKFKDYGLGQIDTYANFSLELESLKCDFILNITSKVNKRFFKVYFQDGNYIKCDIMLSAISGSLDFEQKFANNLPYIEQFRFCNSADFQTNYFDALNVVQIIQELKNC